MAVEDETVGDELSPWPDDVQLEDLPPESDEPQVDPHYLELLRGSKLPQAYLPPAMTGPQKPWVRIAALIVIGVFLLATGYGVCLTYGIGSHPFF